MIITGDAEQADGQRRAITRLAREAFDAEPTRSDSPTLESGALAGFPVLQRSEGERGERDHSTSIGRVGAQADVCD